MKRQNHIIRLLILVTIGSILTYMTYQFKYSTFFFDATVYVVISLMGITFLAWTLFKDIKLFRIKHEKRYLLTSITGIAFIGIILTLNWKIDSTFDKPTLLRIYYDGGFNGTGIDFKIDGTYIFDNSAMGLSNYQYGTYEIKSNVIILDKTGLDSVIKSNRLEIRQKTNKYPDRSEDAEYVYQVNKSGELIPNEIEFRVVIDNRNE